MPAKTKKSTQRPFSSTCVRPINSRANLNAISALKKASAKNIHKGTFGKSEYQSTLMSTQLNLTGAGPSRTNFNMIQDEITEKESSSNFMLACSGEGASDGRLKRLDV